MRQIPLFPLVLLPLPGELIPLHIFEPRYRQLLQDMESRDISFGIYCNHELNIRKIGSVMKLETVLKKHKTGESDIIVRCIDVFSMDKMYRTFRDKMYPGGDVKVWEVNDRPAPPEVYEPFVEYQKQRNITSQSIFHLYQIASELNLDLYERYRLLTSAPEKVAGLILNHLKFQMHLMSQEKKVKDLYHLN